MKNVPIQRWQPYYYDLFNRVGNLTILSLNSSVSTQVEEMERSRFAL